MPNKKNPYNYEDLHIVISIIINNHNEQKVAFPPSLKICINRIKGMEIIATVFSAAILLFEVLPMTNTFTTTSATSVTTTTLPPTTTMITKMKGLKGFNNILILHGTKDSDEHNIVHVYGLYNDESSRNNNIVSDNYNNNRLVSSTQSAHALITSN
jgi:hypothetical protein